MSPARTLYFIEAGDGGPIKIGIARDVWQRFDAHQTSSPYPLRLLGIIDHASHAMERAIHDRFKHLRMRGEWHKPAPELLEYIEDFAGPPPPKRAAISTVKIRLIELGMTRADLARRLGMRYTSLANILTSRRRITDRIASEIAGILGIDKHAITGEKT